MFTGHLRPRCARDGARSLWLIATAGVAFAAFVVWMFVYHPVSRCEETVKDGDNTQVIEICTTSYHETGDLQDLYWAAKAALNIDDIDAAEVLASGLLAGRFLGDGHRILSFVALRRGLRTNARLHAKFALAMHTLIKDIRGIASDEYQLSITALADGDFQSASTWAQQALELARHLDDPHTEINISFASADASRRVGELASAIDTLASAIERAQTPCDKAYAYLKHALCQMELAQDALAMLDLSAAAEANRKCASVAVSTAVSLNQAWLLRGSDPDTALRKVKELEDSDSEGVETELLRAYIAADRHQLAKAQDYLSRAAELVPLDADWLWVVECAKGELAELQAGPDSGLIAEAHYRHAIEIVAKLRATAVAQSAFFVSSHRRPFDDLFALFARQQRWNDALAVVLDLDASDMLRATANEAIRGRQPPFHSGSSSRPIMSRPTLEDVLTAWGTRDLVAVIAPSQREIGGDHQHAYRLRITNGMVTGDDVGDAAMTRTWANALAADPGNRDAALALGRVIVPPDASTGELDVLAIGALGRAPLAALRDGTGSLHIRTRPLARVLSLVATGPDSVGGDPSLVIANPTGDLPAASIEGTMVAKALGPEGRLCGAATSCMATRSQLWTARNADVLHVAAHVKELGPWRALHLPDGDVPPAEMFQRHLAPRLAVLASCGSAAATDEEGWGSIAAALLESGTTVVIATDRNVQDAAARELVQQFYAQADWRTDPPRALARVQQALEANALTSTDPATRPQVWAAFGVLRRPPVVSVVRR